MKRFLYSIFISMVLLTSANATKFGDAVDKVEGSKKLILVELTQDFCPFCDRMESEVLSKVEVKKIISEKYLFLKLNIKRDYVPDMMTSRLTPTFYFVSNDGEQVFDSIQGLVRKSDFIFYLEEVYSQKVK